ncbi:branched-chain amino acid ABC transporter permease [Bradyrhizobium sp. SSUT112]|uniref:branched-chain amino acid ABC transporter permease n=1 Tax=Bradyrhizobium sp. SSUT112 TaxID=3040604 RepID=UPI00244AF9F8|nr:branched-chain amino acid ABC transporter permease [Bradyrhizobium sp. SSUT112]MDH2352272.1 branched-chain amino acid ABC transporter permease [Bradyrhizobium sp. SSUT112]
MSELVHGSKAGVPAHNGSVDAARLSMLALVAALALLPLLAGGFLLYSLSLCFANALAVLSVSMLVRYGGEVSIGHSFFVALGAYAVAIVEHRLGLSIAVSLPLAILLGAGAGFAFAFPSRRLSGIYLAVATMALALALPEILIGFEKLTGGFEGLYIAQDLVAGVSKALQRYYVALVVLVVVCLALAHFRRSAQGLALLIAQAQPRAAEAMGITRSWARISIFTVSAALASLAGALTGFASSTVSPNSFTFFSGVFLLVGSVVSLNRLSLPAALVGGAFITLVPTYLANAGDWVPILYGAALVVVTLVANAGDLRRFLPGGRR